MPSISLSNMVSVILGNYYHNEYVQVFFSDKFGFISYMMLQKGEVMSGLTAALSIGSVVVEAITDFCLGGDVTLTFQNHNCLF